MARVFKHSKTLLDAGWGGQLLLWAPVWQFPSPNPCPMFTKNPSQSSPKTLHKVHQKPFTKFTNYYCFNNLRIAPNHQKPILCSVRPNQSEISPVSTFPWSNSSSPLHPKLFGAVGIFAGFWKWSLVKSPNFPCISLIKTIVMYNNGAYLWKSPIFGAKKQSHQYLQLLIFANSIFATKNICNIKKPPLPIFANSTQRPSSHLFSLDIVSLI